MYNTENHRLISVKCLSIEIIGNAQGKGRMFKLNFLYPAIHSLELFE